MTLMDSSTRRRVGGFATGVVVTALSVLVAAAAGAQDTPPGPPLIRRAFPLNALRCEDASRDAWHRNCQRTV